MDGNDLNPVINTKGPMMQGPAPRPATAMMPPVVQPMGVAQTNAPSAAQANGATGATSLGTQMGTAMPGTAQAVMPNAAQAGTMVDTAMPSMPGAVQAAPMPMMDTAEALKTQVTSDARVDTPHETVTKIQKIVALVAVAICTGFAVLALAIVVLTNIPRIAELENRLDAIAAQNETMQSQIAALNRRIGYDIDVTFFDGGMPGTTYAVTLQPETREVMVTVYDGCSLTDITGCEDEPETYETLLSVAEYDLVVKVYNEIDGSSANYTKNMLAWTEAILAVIQGDEMIADTESQDWEIIKIYDANNDGVVSSREYGTYLLKQMIK